MTSVLVTGAGGFIGQKLVPAAQSEGYQVLSVARRPLAGHSVVLDLRGSLDALPAADWVIHLAGAYAGADLKTLAENDLRIAGNLIEWGLKRGVRNWVFSSAAEVYGVCRDVVTELAPTQPVIPYGVVKLRLEGMFAELARETPQARVVVLRIGEVYGREGKLVDELVRRLLSGFCPWFGSGEVPVSFVHVEDVVRAILASTRRAERGFSLWNVADDTPATWRQFLEELAVLLGARKPIGLPLLAAHLYAAGSSLADRLRGRPPVVTQHVVKLLTTPKALSNRKLKRDLGVEFTYSDFRCGLGALLERSASQAA